MSRLNRLRVIQDPTINNETVRLTKNAFAQRCVLILVGNCWVNYEGRASSSLEHGERILLVKEDGSVLIHRPTGYEPVNWQPSGCIFHTRIKDKTLQIKAIRRSPPETIHIHFDKLYLLSVMKLEDRGEFSLYASESDMQKAVLTEPSLIEVGFKPISYEKKVEPGFIDVYGIDKDDKLVIVEIKRKTAGRNAILQLSKYIGAVQKKANREVRGIIAAPNIARGTQKLLTTLGLDYKPLDPRRCAAILQKNETRKLSEYFNPIKQHKSL